MKTALAVLIIFQSVLYTLQMIRIGLAKTPEDETRWRLRSLGSLGMIVLLILVRSHL